MNKTYIILGLILLAVAFGLVLLPENEKSNELSPELLLQKINNPSRFLSPDLVAERLINEDPSIKLIDVRNEDEFKSYSLPNAFNIPLSKITDEKWDPYLNSTDVDIVLFSNSDLKADQAWVLGTRMGYKNLYIMEGGLNRWFENIMDPKQPEASDPSETHELYNFRKAACLYFGGGSQINNAAESNTEPVNLIRRKKKTETSGGC